MAKTASKLGVQSSADHVVDLNWKTSTPKNVAGYNIYRGPDGKSWKKVNVRPTASTICGSPVADRSTYFYAAAAVDIKGEESTKSNIAKTAIP